MKNSFNTSTTHIQNYITIYTNWEKIWTVYYLFTNHLQVSGPQAHGPTGPRALTLITQAIPIPLSKMTEKFHLNSHSKITHWRTDHSLSLSLSLSHLLSHLLSLFPVKNDCPSPPTERGREGKKRGKERERERKEKEKREKREKERKKREKRGKKRKENPLKWHREGKN